jgi:hypothetical protein
MADEPMSWGWAPDEQGTWHRIDGMSSIGEDTTAINGLSTACGLTLRPSGERDTVRRRPACTECDRIGR